MPETEHALLHEAREVLTDAQGEISRAVESLANGQCEDVPELLGEAKTRLQVFEAKLGRHLGT